jgi:hypothetical protein
VTSSIGSHRTCGSVSHTDGIQIASAHSARFAPWSMFGPSLVPNGSCRRAVPSTNRSSTVSSRQNPKRVVSISCR